MDDEIKDLDGQTPEEETQEQDSHSDYKPADRFDASAVHHLSGMYKKLVLRLRQLRNLGTCRTSY